MRFAALALAPLALASPLGFHPVDSNEPTHASLQATRGQHINDAYIVVFKKGVNPEQIALHLGAVEQAHEADPLMSIASDGSLDSGGINHVYAPSISNFGYFGYAGKFAQSTLDTILASPEVDYVERDQVMYTQDIPRGVDNWDAIDSDAKTTGDISGIVTEQGAPWGLARISHRAPLHLSTFARYVYDHDGGDGVTAYVVDTGINVDHVEFEGRASWGKTIPKNDVDEDGNGHGTHCAGTVASRKYGVAKAAKLIAVKVLGSNGSGSMSDVVAGVVWAAEHAAAAAAAAAKELATTGKTKHKGSVANMSLGGSKAKALDDAVDAAVEAGLHFAVAAGNDNRDACDYSPAGAEKAITVGASTLGDERAYFSNHGKCVDVFAPGLSILSTWTGGNETSNTISGTSMASPHICGLLAYLISIHGSQTFNLENLHLDSQSASLYSKAYSLLPKLIQTFLPIPFVTAQDDSLLPIPAPHNETLNPAVLKQALIAIASPGMLVDLPEGSPNLLAFNNATLPEKRK